MNLLGIPIKSIIALILTILLIYVMISFVKQWEKKEINKKLSEEKHENDEEINNEESAKNKTIFSEFMIKRNVIPLTIGVLLSLRLRTMINILVDTIVDPLFNIDYDKDGTPDIREISNLIKINIFGIKYNFGKLFLEIIKISLFSVIVYFFIIILYVNTNFLNISFNN